MRKSGPSCPIESTKPLTLSSIRISVEKPSLSACAFMGNYDEPRLRAQMYAEQYRLTLGDELGAGVHGIVFATERQSQTHPIWHSVVKAHQGEIEYGR